MSDILIGLIVSCLVAGFLEVFTSFDKKLVGSLTLVGIAFIYVVFSWHDLYALAIVIVTTLLFTVLAYYGYTRNSMYVVSGLILHGIWDLVFPFLSSTVPEGYDLFCITVDFVLAFYLYVRVVRQKLNH